MYYSGLRQHDGGVSRLYHQSRNVPTVAEEHRRDWSRHSERQGKTARVCHSVESSEERTHDYVPAVDRTLVPSTSQDRVEVDYRRCLVDGSAIHTAS
ncbi:MAG: hypothetical protein J6T78_03995 [Bacteroidaceae bacterium]|nr:hypothetical protein [Bacteroidaceae bacterium]